MFKVGDKVQITSPYNDVEAYRGCVGVITFLPVDEEDFFGVKLEGTVNELEFFAEEIEPF